MEGRSQTRWSLKGLDKICSQIQTKTCLIRCDPHFDTNLLLHRYYTFFDKIPFEHRNLGNWFFMLFDGEISFSRRLEQPIDRDAIPGDHCALCRKELKSNREVDHRLPKARGGPDSLDNLQWMHPACNLAKGTKLMAWMARPS